MTSACWCVVSGRNEEEMVSVDLLVEEARDFSRDMVMLCYSPNFHQARRAQCMAAE